MGGGERETESGRGREGEREREKTDRQIDRRQFIVLYQVNSGRGKGNEKLG